MFWIWRTKKKYEVHYKNLLLYQSLGMKLTKGIWRKALDAAWYLFDEWAAQKGKIGIRKWFLQIDEQFSIWQDNGEFPQTGWDQID